MSGVVLVARILFVLLFFMSAMGHLTNVQAMTGYAESRGVPQPRLGVQVSGIWIGIAGLMVLLGIWGDLGALALGAFVVATAVLMHNFWRETDAQAKMQEQIQFLKDVALAGGALALFAALAVDGGPGLTITGPLFEL